MKKPIKSRFKTEAGYKRALKKYNDFVEANKTTKKSVTKNSVTKKPVAKKPVAKKPAGKVPAKRGRPLGSKNKPASNQKLKIAKETAGKTGKFLKEQGKKVLDTGKKQYGKLKTKFSAKDQTPQQRIPEGKSKGAKVAKKLNQKIGNYAKRVYNKAALDTFKFKEVMKDPSKRNINKSGVKRGLGAGAVLTIGNALSNRLTKPKGMSNKEWSDFKAKKEQEGVEKRRKLIKKGYDFYGKRLKKVSSDIKEKGNKNKNNDKKVTSNKNNNKLKVKKDKNGLVAPTQTNPNNKTKVTSRPKKMHAIEKRNREIFGDAHVEKLKTKHAAWKERRKKKKTLFR